MTDEEKKEYMAEFALRTKTYCHIDYDDDDEIIKMIIEATLDELGDLIPGFDPYAMTSRQKLLVMMFVNDQYDHRDVYQDRGQVLSNAASSALLSEMYRGGG